MWEEVCPRCRSMVVSTCLVFLLFTQAFAEHFLDEPDDTAVVSGSTIVLKCSIENIIGNVQWTRDGFGLGMGRDLPGYSRYTITGAESLGEYDMMISNAQLEDDAIFQCQVGRTSFSSGLMSRQAKVTVWVRPHDPVIEGVIGEKLEVVADEPTNITCHANGGKSAANISWFSSGVKIEDNTYYSSQAHADSKLQDATGLLTVTPRKSDHGKSYECHVLNEALPHPEWTRIKLEVLYKPEVTMTVNPARKIKEYGMVTFTCQATGNPDVITWKWYKADDVIPNETSSRLVLLETTRDYHSNAISCEAINKVGSARQKYIMNVEYGPQFVTQPEHVAADIGEDAELKCHVDGNPAPAIIWTRNESPRILSSSMVLKITDVEEEDFGVYTCRSSVIGFQEISMKVHLLKKGPPTIVSEGEQSARFGDTGVVECVLLGVPKPEKIVWFRNGIPLDTENLSRYNTRMQDLPNGRKSILEIQSVQDKDYGKYNCSAENGYGTASMLISFTKQSVVQVAYILAGVLVGVFIIIVVAVVIFVYHRKKSTHSDSSSEGSSDDSIRKPDIVADPKAGGGVYGSPIDAWRQDNFDPKYYRHSAEYDELSYPPRDPRDPRGPGPYDYDPGYGNYAYDRDPRRDAYGTYPGSTASTSRLYDSRYPQDNYAPAYPGSDYGTYRTPPHGGPLPSNFAHPPPPAPPSILNSKLATNV